MNPLSAPGEAALLDGSQEPQKRRAANNLARFRINRGGGLYLTGFFLRAPSIGIALSMIALEILIVLSLIDVNSLGRRSNETACGSKS